MAVTAMMMTEMVLGLSSPHGLKLREGHIEN